MTHPLKAGDTLFDHAKPMDEVLAEVGRAIADAQVLEQERKALWKERMEYEATKEELRVLKAHMRALSGEDDEDDEGEEDDDDEDEYEEE